MPTLKAFKEILKVEGVDQYILVDGGANITIHRIKEPESIARIVSTGGKTFKALGKEKFKHVVFRRENKKNLLIFPLGNYYLGVIKSKVIDDITLAKNIETFIKSLS